MVQNFKNDNSEPLGTLLKEQREKSNITLKTVNKTTKIPIATLRAMEADEYNVLPPLAFARGFYSIYAQFLGLDSAYILKLFQQNNRKSDQKKIQAAGPRKLHRQIKALATQPSIGPGTIVSFGLVLLVVVSGLISWSIGWNPASYLSEKIRSNKQNSSLDMVDNKTEEQVLKEIQYYLQAHFPAITKVTVIKDDNDPENYLFQAGDTRSWMAKNRITMILPEESKTRLTVNGLIKPLPDPDYGVVTIKIPLQ